MTPWDEYVAAARRLDAVRRATAAAVAEHTAVLKAARDDLTAVRARQSIQQARLRDTAHQAGVDPPVLTPQPADVTAAQAALGAAPTPHAVRASLHAARATLDTADAVLSGLAEATAGPPRSPRPRNALIYGGYALLAVLLEVVAFLSVSEGAASLLVVGCGLVLPVFVFALGWVTAGAFRPVNRTPALGVGLSLLSLVPLLAMAVWVGAQAFRK
jgi:hypothetical protein